MGGEGKPAAARRPAEVGRRSHRPLVSSAHFRPCAVTLLTSLGFRCPSLWCYSQHPSPLSPISPFPACTAAEETDLTITNRTPVAAAYRAQLCPRPKKPPQPRGSEGAPTALSLRRACPRRGAGGPGSVPRAVLRGLNPSLPRPRRGRGSRRRSCRLAAPNGRFGAAAEGLGGGGRWFRGPPGPPAEEEALPPGLQIRKTEKGRRGAGEEA
ncbi:uncharacterized protein [Notamacropus eugenii]|uniref:uncharacterized protein n=1 Tax=Notamacropus eugenii TaxID=9315 RepID=UPI003B670432